MLELPCPRRSILAMTPLSDHRCWSWPINHPLEAFAIEPCSNCAYQRLCLERMFATAMEAPCAAARASAASSIAECRAHTMNHRRRAERSDYNGMWVFVRSSPAPHSCGAPHTRHELAARHARRIAQVPCGRDMHAWGSGTRRRNRPCRFELAPEGGTMAKVGPLPQRAATAHATGKPGQAARCR